jgi:hypothetical protein
MISGLQPMFLVSQNARRHKQNAYVSELAGVAELADALDSKSSDRKIVWVRAPPPAEPFKVQRRAFDISQRRASFFVVKKIDRCLDFAQHGRRAPGFSILRTTFAFSARANRCGTQSILLFMLVWKRENHNVSS